MRRLRHASGILESGSKMLKSPSGNGLLSTHERDGAPWAARGECKRGRRFAIEPGNIYRNEAFMGEIGNVFD